MKVYAVIMAAMSFIVLGFAIAGTADYFIRQKVTAADGSFNDMKLGLWRFKTQSKDAAGNHNPGSPSTVKIHGGSDEAKAFRETQTCGGFVDHIKAATAFAIMTCIFAFVSLIGFILNITGQDMPLGFIGAGLTMLCSLVTWAIMAAIRNRKHCKDKVSSNIVIVNGLPTVVQVEASINLDNKDKQDPIYHFYNGFYFFLIPWILFVLAFIAAIILKSGEKSSSSSSSETTTTTTTVISKTTTTTTETKEESTSESKSENTEQREANPLSVVPVETKDTSNEDEKKRQEAEEEEKKRQEKAKEDEKKRQQAEEEEKKRQEEAEERKRKLDEEEKSRQSDEEAEAARLLNEQDVERRKDIWADLKTRLPTDKKDKDQRRKRFDLFQEFDRGDKKYLTPSDLDHGCKTVLGLGQLKKGLAHILPKAHANARSANQAKGKAKTTAEENVERCEFRLVFVNIKELFDLWFMFDTIDVASTGAISPEEFERGVPTFKEWGKDVEDHNAEFANANKSGSGKISFNEFCDWAKKNSLEDDEDVTDNDESPDQEDEDEARRRNAADVERRRAIWKDLAHRLPTNKASKEERARRFQYFREFDTNSNGFLTLADVEEGCSTILGLGQLGKGLKHLLPLAHNSARGVANVKGQNNDADQHVEKSEMRLLFVYIHQYFDLWFLFDTLDVANTGHISLEEFQKGITEVEEWAGVKIENAEEEFEIADTGKTGELIFLEFCEWAHHKNTKDE